MMKEKRVMGRRFDPKRYGMIHCPACNGAGKLFNGVEGKAVCKICGGFGFIMKQEENNFDEQRVR